MEQQIHRMLVTVAFAASISGATSGLAETAAEKCQAAKNKAVGKYALCRQKTEAKLATTGDGASYNKALGKCAIKNSAAWQKLEANAAGACPSSGDEVDVASVVNGCTLSVARAVGGGSLSDCGADLALCSDDIQNCEMALSGTSSRTLQTGQTDCFDAEGTLIACAGTGQDGELQKGVARSYTDNGDGTITDNSTGLMWEKLSDDGSIHDKEGFYTWANAFAVKIETLNSTAFAGYGDWRLPNPSELLSLVDLGSESPAIHSVFNSSCTEGCTVTTCSCTRGLYYWSATSLDQNPLAAWAVDFYRGDMDARFKNPKNPLIDLNCVRAVRGG